MIRFACATVIAVTLSGAGSASAQPAPGTEPSGESPATPESGDPPSTSDTTGGAPAAAEGTETESAPAGGGETTTGADKPEDTSDDSQIQEDVQPRVSLLKTSDLEVRIGGLVQVHAAPYVGEDSLIENGDPATRAGFRLRRSRFGIEGRFKAPLRILLAVDLLELGEDIGTVSDAKLTYDFAPELSVSLGTSKVPFARGSLETSRLLPTIERPLSIIEIAPEHRLGVTVEGAMVDGRLLYVAGLMNGTEGFGNGNEYGGFISGGRVQYTIMGEPSGLDVKDGVAVGASGYYEDAPATNGFAAAGDVLAAFSGVKLTVEALCDTRKPDDSPDVAPTIADEITRCGAYGTGQYQIPDMPIEPAVRVELFDDNRDVEDAGDVWLIAGGVNSMLIDPYLRAQLHYIRRVERHGPVRANDALVLSVMGSF
jgi:hypothetical protein